MRRNTNHREPVKGWAAYSVGQTSSESPQNGLIAANIVRNDIRVQ